MRSNDSRVYRCPNCGGWAYRGRECPNDTPLADRWLTVSATVAGVTFLVLLVAMLAAWWAPTAGGAA